MFKVFAASYSWLADFSLAAQITSVTNGTTVMTTTKGYDALNRLTNTVTVDAGLGTLDSHRYAFNSANRGAELRKKQPGFALGTFAGDS